jgi:hypothetical protein
MRGWCRVGLLFCLGGRDGAGSVEDVESEVAATFDPFVVLLPTRRMMAVRSGKTATSSSTWTQANAEPTGSSTPREC